MRRFPLLAALLVLAVPATAQEAGEDSVYAVVEQMPELIGGLASIRLVYPAAERRAGIEGRVFLQFVVNEDGSVSEVTVTRSAGPGLDSAAVAAVRPIRFTPGIQRGRPVRVRFSLPISFRLDGPPPPRVTRTATPLVANDSGGGLVLTQVPEGRLLHPISCSAYWCRIDYGGHSGYVAMSALQIPQGRGRPGSGERNSNR